MRGVLTALILVVAASIPLAGSPAGTFARGARVNRIAGLPSISVCPAVPAGEARCLAQVGTPLTPTKAPIGLSPTRFKAVYQFPTSPSAGAGQTIAVVDAFDDPTAESDLGVFDGQFGLPPCTTANGCFSKVDATGGNHYPKKSGNWALEMSLDVQWAHAIAPGANILLVEAQTNRNADMYAAEDYARTHAQYVSNSWVTNEYSGERNDDVHFVQPGTSFFAGSGDSGLPPVYPSASPYIISVGGTVLHFDRSGNFIDETGWHFGGGGCSRYETANPAQAGFSGYAQVHCNGKRATPDVALDAAPTRSSGVAVYDGTKYQGYAGWWWVGGTSASTPEWAARSADAGIVVDASAVYSSTITYRDITKGNNGAPCLVGYDLCSGRGSWIGDTP
ncbi:MAG TPA: S53 family peptidase [Chloroflexota bacterium]|nr:S53 family peptidase [Chloroflexota bacterium]